MTYTKGKWTCYKIASHYYGLQEDVNNLPFGEITFKGIDYREAKLNAKLIESAPRLLEALKIAKQDVSKGSLAEKRIIEAIKKAEG